MPIIFVMIASLMIAFLWDKFIFIKDFVHIILDPSAGWLLNWNLIIGMTLIVFLISLFSTLVQKFATDQKTLRELKNEQKEMQEEMKKYNKQPEKMAELSRKQMDFFKRNFKLNSRPIIFTGIPFILFFRWFQDFFGILGNPKFFGFMDWLIFYLLFSIVFSSILRKALKVV